MNGSKFSILLVLGLLGLLGLLATLQYRWLGQISDGERERMQKRLELDSQRFADDFNREIRNAYFTFQIDAKSWKDNDYTEFNERLNSWKSNTIFTTLIKDFYFVKDEELRRYDRNSHQFVITDWTDEVKTISQKFGQDKGFEAINENFLTLSLPIYENPQRISISGQKLAPTDVPPNLTLPKTFGFLIIKLDEDVIKNQIFPTLSQKYFFEGESAAYNLKIVSKANQSDVIFASQQTSENLESKYDIEIPLFNLTPGTFAVFLNQAFLTKINSDKNVVFGQPKKETTLITVQNNLNDKKIKVETRNGSQRTQVFQNETPNQAGFWSLNINHRDGSLDNFIGNTRRKNLAVSFSILGLLGISIGLIFISARRAQSLAQKQMDFVSAVSHEFRTPIAVIHSAGENLTDGIVNSQERVQKYGDLIKGEGKKLSAMVEQILEFAGSRSGHKKYDFREVDVKNIIENALAECQPLLMEKEFKVEINFAENLPSINADSNSLSHAVQNLIINAVKYDNGNKILKISTKNGDGTVKISVKDHGIGIAKKDIAKIFAPFYRAKDVVDAQIHGNGLGLSLVKQTVEAHHGKIKVESEIGKGSKFVIQLPLNS